MAVVAWCSGLELGIGEIDDDHRDLARLINDLGAAHGAGKTEQLRLLERLFAATRAHFAHEESLMKSFRYLRLAQHKRTHDELLIELRQLIRRVEAGRVALDARFADHLGTWLTSHIHGADRALAYFLRDRRLALVG